MNFERGETVVLSIEVRDEDDALTSPATSMTVAITDPDGIVVQVATAMTNTGGVTGLYHYDYLLGAAITLGIYEAEFKATDGSRVTIERDQFTVIE